MAGLQRSATTFRRSGSSGLVWDERFLTEADAEEDPQPELRHSRSVGSIGMLRLGGGDSDNKKAKEKKQKQGHKEEARSNQQVFRTKDVAPDMDPPSPRVSGCILCAVFGGGSGGAGKARRRSKPRKK